LFGLNPGSSNTLYLYSGAHDSGSKIVFPSSYGGDIDPIDVVQFGVGNGIIIQYDYIADGDGTFTVAAAPQLFASRLHISGFANEETGVQNPQISVDNMLSFGEVAVSGSKILPLEIANIGGGVVDGNITGIASPFSLSTNVYYAVPGSNDTISVTFSPINEEDYTNTITLTGNGGTEKVTLIGTGVPEPISVIGYLSCFALMLRRINFRPAHRSNA